MSARSAAIAVAICVLVHAASCNTAPPTPIVVDGTERPIPRRAADPLVVAADGEVIGADRIPASDRLTANVVLTLRDDEREPLAIELAPGWYLEERGLRFRPGERVEVLGTPAPITPGRRTLRVWQIRTPEGDVQLRDESGRPLWRESSTEGGR